MSSFAEHLCTMVRSNAWANHRLLKACAKLDEEEYRAQRVNFFPSIELTLNRRTLASRDG
jgi:uncharacterized damage-inducible protein DinB